VFNDQRLEDVDAWLAIFGQAGLPVLRHSVAEIARLKEDEDNANGRVLAGVILHDPLLTIRVLAYIEENRRKRQTTDITTIDRAIMMIGIVPFFKAFHGLPVIEVHLHEHPQALLGLLKAIGRARRAAHWARDWAILRRDMDVDEITLATLLHDIAEMMMWLYAPRLALQFSAMQRDQPTRRSVHIQEEIYGVPLFKLKLALAEAWRLPTLVIQLLDHRRQRIPGFATSSCRRSGPPLGKRMDRPRIADFKAIRDLLHVNQETLVRHLNVGDDAELILALDAPPP
jgi:HD-like signal output (HDOD) protein